MLTNDELQQIENELRKDPEKIIGGRLQEGSKYTDVFFRISNDMLSIEVQYWIHKDNSDFLSRSGSLHSYFETADKELPSWSYLLSEVDRVINDPDVLMFTN
mgnify:CR=1 FL=1